MQNPYRYAILKTPCVRANLYKFLKNYFWRVYRASTKNGVRVSFGLYFGENGVLQDVPERTPPPILKYKFLKKLIYKIIFWLYSAKSRRTQGVP